MLRKFTHLLSLAFVAAALIASPAKAETKINFKLDWTIYGVHAPFYLALDKGLYKKEGLDVTITEGQGSATVMQMVAQGQDQMALVDFSTLLFGVEQGLPVVAVMRIVSDMLGVISPADAPIKSPKELEGKIIAYAPSESSGVAFGTLMAADGGDIKKVNILSPATGAKNTLLLQRRADAIPGNVNVQPAQIEKLGMKTTHFLYSDFGVSFMAQGLVANKEFLEKNPEAVKGFVKATVEAIKLAQANPKEAIDAIIKILPQQERNRDVLMTQWQASLPGLTTKNTKDKPMGAMVAEDWTGMQEVLEKGGALKVTVKAEDIFTNDYLPQ
ncbi:NitT/TauT family transport system substrate-binding protein [Rhodoligotrophos appendicifer]|uniref:ABC transporter substrate-binding protein n=1 Tax=Rhodoligotrophos appendicifer TaxID=987056 RepID=UPI001478580F|nr:ABC transporter substrate-binding protein [Rhodoligotrophos appendicifer]